MSAPSAARKRSLMFAALFGVIALFELVRLVVTDHDRPLSVILVALLATLTVLLVRRSRVA